MIDLFKNIIPELNPTKVLKNSVKTEAIHLLVTHLNDINNDNVNDDALNELILLLKTTKLTKAKKKSIFDQAKNVYTLIETSIKNKIIKKDNNIKIKVVADNIIVEDILLEDDETVLDTDKLVKNNDDINDDETILDTDKLVANNYDIIDINTDKLVANNYDIIDINTDTIKIVSIEDIAAKLDSNTKSYNKYTKNNPMRYISYDDSKNIYISQYKGNKYKSKNLSELTDKLINLLGVKNQLKKLDIYPIDKIEYKTKIIILYDSLITSLFDINHIIGLLDIEDAHAHVKYTAFKDKITHYGFLKNKFGGYIVKEFIPENVMFDIILSSTSTFSKEFKTDISYLLVELRKNNIIIIKDDKIQMNKNIIDNVDIRPDIHTFLEEYKTNNIYSYNDKSTLMYVKSLIIKGSHITYVTYNKMPTLYACILLLDEPDYKNRPIIKFGFSEDIIKRFKDLEREYKCKLYVVGLKRVIGQSCERAFHALLKKFHTELHLPTKVYNAMKDEIYLLSEKLMNEFYKLPEQNIVNTIEISEEYKYMEQCLKDQYSCFLSLLKISSDTEFLEVITKIPGFNIHHENTMIKYIKTTRGHYDNELQYIHDSFTESEKMKHEKFKLEHIANSTEKERAYNIIMKDKEIITIMKDKDLKHISDMKDKDIKHISDMKDKEIIMKDKEIENNKMIHIADMKDKEIENNKMIHIAYMKDKEIEILKLNKNIVDNPIN